MVNPTPKRSGKTQPATDRPKSAAKKPPSTAVRPSKARAKPAAASVYQVKITLDMVRPPVWRRVLVQDCTLAELHDVIQICMGWDDYHLHLFVVRDEQYGDPEQWPEDPWEEDEVKDEGKVKLSDFRARGIRKLRYEYDMGDDWLHTIMIEKVVPAEAGVRYPRCIEGARACPPEDSGGPWGYSDYLEAVRDPNHPRHNERVEWIGDFDPEPFDLDAVNKKLTGSS